VEHLTPGDLYKILKRIVERETGKRNRREVSKGILSRAIRRRPEFINIKVVAKMRIDSFQQKNGEW
jgi:hypothetical protein